jgi:uncharacterized protein (TIGR00369 family)
MAGMPFKIPIPFITALGFELQRFEGGEAEIALTPRDDQMNSWNVLHGGVTMTLLDAAMAHAARSPIAGSEPDPRGVVTIEMKTSFMLPGIGRVVAHGRLLHKTQTLAFCEGLVRDAQGALIAHASGTFKYLKALPAGGRRIQRLNASD